MRWTHGQNAMAKLVLQRRVEAMHVLWRAKQFLQGLVKNCCTIFAACLVYV